MKLVVLNGMLAAGWAVAQGPPYYPPPETAGGWRALVTANALPAAGQKAVIRKTAGLDWDRLEAGWTYCETLGGPHRLLVIRHGWVAGEWHNFSEPRGIASCTKSLTAVAVAKLADQGRIRIDDEAWRYLPPAWAEAEARRKRIRILHLLTMSSGQEPYDGPYQDLEAYAKKVLNVGIEAPPGSVWAYASAPVDQLSLIVEKATGAPMREFFHREISEPIGAAPFEWPDFEGHTGGSGGPRGGARVTPRDLARIGYLMLHRGRWGNRQVLSSKSVALLTQWAPWLRNLSYREPNYAREKQAQHFYGCLWWTHRTQQPLGEAVPADVYYMSGFGKQACWVFPSLDMIVVRLGSNRPLNDRPEFYRELLSRVMGAVEK
jgi:CubicO group peptidase (beta-lactamase class C family)